MKLSRYFLPLLKEVPQEAQIISHQLMLRAGMICQEMAGLYSWLPLGTRVLQKVANIIREEQNKINSHEVIMPTLQPADLWKETDRYESYGKEMLRIKDRHDRELIYSPTNEEMVTMIFKRFVKSYRQLPCCLYQIQWKFRDEIRPRFGVMRCREFYMKDAYSFDINAVEARKTYYKMVEAYLKTFARMGLTAIPVRADAGPIGGDLSHEFHVLAETGESAIYYDKAFDAMQYGDDINVAEILEHYAAADEMHDSEICPVPAENLRESRGIEVGHIFNFGSKYTHKLGALVTDESGQQIAPEGGCYGIGAGRVVAAIIEASHDKYGIIWPESVAPFTLGILNLKVGDSECDQAANNLYNTLEQAGVEVLLDDTKDSPGAKFSRMDLIGLPWQVVVGPKGLKAGTLEVKERKTGERLQLTINQVLDKFVGAT